MLDETIIRQIFYDALELHRRQHCVNDNQIAKAIISIQNGYAAKQANSRGPHHPLNYNQPAYRCGYLHKYAACHASLVQFVLNCIGPDVFDNLFEHLPFVNICCIGGGPGTDVIGLSTMLYTLPCLVQKFVHFYVVDCMLEWRKAFESVFQASLACRSFGAFLLRSTCSYLRADMLACIPDPVSNSIATADLVTMVKFVSAASSSATPGMLQAVFTMMKPDASFLFIDNAGGGFYQLVSQVARRCGLATLWGPVRHLKYENELFKRKMFGFFSLSSTTVAVQMWRKTYPITLNVWQNHMTSSTNNAVQSLRVNKSVRQTHHEQDTSHFSGDTSGAAKFAGKFPASSGTKQNQNLPSESDPEDINIHFVSSGIQSAGDAWNSGRNRNRHLPSTSSSGSDTLRSNRDEQTIECCCVLL